MEVGSTGALAEPAVSGGSNGARAVPLVEAGGIGREAAVKNTLEGGAAVKAVVTAGSGTATDSHGTDVGGKIAEVGTMRGLDTDGDLEPVAEPALELPGTPHAS